MLRDVFYFGKKPNVHPREQHAKNLRDARKKATTEHFWIINEFSDYKNFDWDFDFDFLPDPDVWTENHNNVWPSQHQKDSGTWLCPKVASDVVVYRNDVDPVKRKKITSDNWKILENIDTDKWDFSWHPDPSDPPYIYKWGSKYAPVELKACIEYRVPGATEIKYLNTTVELLPNWDFIVEVQKVDQSKWDMSWRPNPMDPPYIYVWGNKYVDGRLKSTLEYHVPGATEKKYMPELVPVLPEWDRWIEHVPVDKEKTVRNGFDFAWRPDPREPAYNYVWGNPYEPAEITPTLEYRMPGATQIKYVGKTVDVLPQTDRWVILEKIDKTSFDFSWRPDPREPELIYVFGNEQYDGTVMPTIEYHMPNATERKYIYDIKAKLAPCPEKFQHLENSTGIDYSWVPDPTSPPYIYVWGNQWNKPEDKISIQYVVEGATEYKYMEERATRKPCSDNWIVPKNVDTTGFDFSWEPSPADPPYIYEFGTQWQKTGGPRYVVEGATEIKYIEFQKVKTLPSMDNWAIPNNLDITGFDFSWHPDSTSPPYVYHFATQWALTGGPIYTVPGATEVKYLEAPSAIALPNKENWVYDSSIIDEGSFDFSWHPYVEDQPYIYQFGTQHQKTGGPRYVTPGALSTSPIKYIDTRILKSKRLPKKDNFAVLNNYKIKDFDYSWHPDDTEEPYIYVFGNNQYSAEIMPTIEYAVPGAKQIKYVTDVVATLDIDNTNWVVPKNVDTTSFDFSWKPNPKDPPYIYQFGTQHQKTGGPRYVVPGATEVKYITTQQVKHLPNKKKFKVLDKLVVDDFDFSWHPDDTDEPYIYVFGNNQYPAEIMPTIEYRMAGATQVKYISAVVAKLGTDKKNWVVPKNVDTTGFDFSWKPNPKDPAYIYEFGTQHQKTGGPRYVVPGATEVKYIDTMTVKRLPNKKNFVVVNKYKIKDFDYSWHPDETDAPYIYVFGNNQYPAEIMPTIEYRVEGATQIKYVTNLTAKLDVDLKNWSVPKNVDVSSFDFSWKPNPKEPAYIYEFGTQWQKTGGPIYTVPGAKEVKYINTQKALATPTVANWTIPSHIDVTNFDFSWHPDATSPPYIYHFATQWALTGGPIYTVPGAVERKYLEEPSAVALPNKDNWEIPDDIDVGSFDFSWHPYVEDQPYIYQFGTQHQKTGGPRYITPGAVKNSPVKYIDTRILKAKKLASNNFAILNNYKIKNFDFSWHPDTTDEPYIYVFGNNQYPAEIMPTIEYATPGAKQIKYVNDIAAVLDTDMSNWEVPEGIDVSNFDFSWKPHPKDPAYIYQFGTQWQKTGGPRYIVPGATEVKYIDTLKVKSKDNRKKFNILNQLVIEHFDFTWHPDDTEEPYIYVFGNNQYPAEIMPTIEYAVSGATERKYINDIKAILGIDKKNWIVPKNINLSTFDFSWKPNPKDPPYIYQFGTQHQKTGGPRYIVEGATEVKYVETQKTTSISQKEKFVILNNYKIKNFDYSWHPDETDEPYIYVFGNNQYPAEIMPTLEYVVPNAKQIKYVQNIVATLDVDMTNWIIPTDVDTTGFDFSWKPNPKEPAYIYEFGTQWQKTGGPRYLVEGATEVKYVDTMKVRKLPDSSKFSVIDKLIVDSFDYSWHPDATEEPYIYVFGNNLYPSTLMPTIEYRVEGASQVKHIDVVSATLGIDKSNWDIPANVDVSAINFYWKPNPKDPPYIYQFGTQHQKTGGPRYVVPGATEIKYVDSPKSTALPVKENFAILDNLKIKDFDYSWHPDETDTPYIYIFGNTQYPAEIMPTIEYRVEGAKQIKYVQNVVATLDADMSNWETPNGIDVSDFDFSWKPNPKDPAYIYEFGTQWQKTGGPRYVVPGATEVKYVSSQKVKALPTKENWTVPSHVDTTNFDFSWHPDATSPPYIYHFATQWALTGGPIYTCAGATEVKYLEYPSAVALPNKDNWEIPDDIDVDSFDFSWHPYVEDQPYVYMFGTQHQKTGGPKYITPGVIPTSPIKYIDTRILKAQKISNKNNFAILNNYRIKDFDWSWHPDATEEPYIYVFGNNQYPAEIMPTIEYAMPGAKQVKYINDIKAVLDVDMSNWEIPDGIDISDFDFSWKPNPKDPALIYQFGTQHQKTGGPRYVVPGATTIKYIDTVKVKALPNESKFVTLNDYKIKDFDYSWHPDATEEPYIYVFGNNQYTAEIMPTIEYRMEGATTVKYVNDIIATLDVDMSNWVIPADVEVIDCDFSWKPNPKDPAYIYEFGTQWQKTGGIKYITPGATETKYIDLFKSKKIASKENFAILNNYKIKDFDWSWHPDNTEQPYIYVFGNNQYSAEIMPTIEYVMPGAKQVKYITDIFATLDTDMSNWVIPDNIDTTGFDFSWKPNPRDPAYIYEFGTQHQKTGGPKYVVEGAIETKYISTQQVIHLSNKDNFAIDPDCVLDLTTFDFSWHPDSSDPPYIYAWGNQWNKAEDKAVLTYTVEGATTFKYMKEVIKSLPNKKHWYIPSDIDDAGFDFSWEPNPHDELFVYQFGTQWQKTGGPKYIIPGADDAPIKYIDVTKAKKLSDKRNFAILNNYKIKDFDWSWHPDETDEPYIYQFGNNQYPAEIMPTIEYAMPGARAIKYISDIVATLDVDMSNWEIPDNVDITGFDFSWKPNPKDPAYVYEFSTQWQKTGGPRYVVPGATEVKYVTTQQVKALPTTSNWELPKNVDVADFDFSWHPDSTSPPYIYHFATQWALSGGPVYKVPGATEVKYMDHPSAKALPNKENWEVPADIDSANFDFSWHPYVEDQPYIYQFGTQHQKTGGPKYITPGVVSTSPTKYIDTRILKATKLSNRNNFTILNNYKIKDFDYSWHPDKTEEPFIYVFGNTQYPAEIMPTIEYAMPGAKQVKYVNSIVATLDDDRTNWEIPDGIDVANFDFSWKPNPKDPAFIYQFGTQWQKTGGPRYVVPGATQVKYVDGSKAKSLPNRRNWILPKDIPIEEFDFSWHPDTTEDAYIYVFGTQWVLTGGPRYIVEGATEYKYMDVNFAKVGPTSKNWVTPSNLVIKDFDYSWHPHPDDPMFIYQFGTQWHDRGGPQYVVTGSNKDTPVKYIDTRIIKATLGPNKTNWEIPAGLDVSNFDFSWIPHPDDPPYIYEFGTQWQKTGGPRYVVAGATEVKYIDGEGLRARRLPNKKYWFNPYKADVTTFDYSWHPDATSPPYIYQFGSEEGENDGPRYIVPGATGDVIYLKRVELAELPVEEVIVETPVAPVAVESLTETQQVIEEPVIEAPVEKCDIFLVDRGNPEAQSRFEYLKTKFGNVQKTRYLNSWVDTINRCINRSSTDLCWILNSELDYTDFDFNYYPNPYQMKMVHVFGTQWSHWGTTFMVNRNTFSNDTKWIKIIEHLSNLNFVKSQYVNRLAKATNCLYDIYVVDHGNSDIHTVNRILTSKASGKSVTSIKYQDNYFDTLKNLLSTLPDKKEHYIWLCSSICDYANFDFTYICDPFAREQLHVFPSNKQKFGDTFLINVNRLRELIDNMENLKAYDKINYNQHQQVQRFDPPKIVTEFDSHVASVMEEFDFPYAVFVTEDNKDITVLDEEPMSLWENESKNILITSTGGTRIIVPKEAKQYVETQLYDYPYIKTSTRLAKSNPLDIVYLSNGEKCAEENYEHLLKITKGLPNRIVRVDGVNGRVQAYHAAAEASNTSWMFTVFAKLKVNPKFDFNWQPDRLQIPKHYMFLAKNPVNGLIYGHQGMIAYNKQMTLDNEGTGLDFTLDSPHETIELLSGTATFNTDEWSTWRTAFREAVKLKKENSEISLKRLESWLTKSEGNYGEYSIQGALHGVEYFDKVKGDINKLKLSYEWDWLKKRFDKQYKR